MSRGPTEERTVAVAGASGIVGQAVVDHFAASGWNVLAVSRRSPTSVDHPRVRHLPVDLLDDAASADAAGELSGVPNLVYAALYEKPGLVKGWEEEDQMTKNLRMLQNLVGPLAAGGALRHMTLLQGTKAYGSHLHDIRIPSKESEPRDPHANFYWLQEDWVRELAPRSGFAYTILRPQMVIGGAVGVAMNVLPAVGAYAAICAQLGEPCGFPGGPPFVWEAADSRLIGACCEWAATTPAASGETFNVTNGDVFAWRDLWPAMMDVLGVEPGPDKPVELAAFLPAHEELWDEIVQEFSLLPLSLAELLGESHHMADYCFAYGQKAQPRAKFISTVKVRQAGFGKCMDTEQSFRYWLGQMVQRGVFPDRSTLPAARST